MTKESVSGRCNNPTCVYLIIVFENMKKNDNKRNRQMYNNSRIVSHLIAIPNRQNLRIYKVYVTQLTD